MELATDHVAIELPLVPQSAATARAAVASLRLGADDSSPDVRLLVSELIADALATAPRPAKTVITVEAEVLDGTTCVMVAFDGLTLQLSGEKPEPAEPGWGIYLGPNPREPLGHPARGRNHLRLVRGVGAQPDQAARSADSSRSRTRPSARQRFTLVNGTVCTGLRLPPLKVPVSAR